MADRVLDCKKLNCPMPIVKISREIKQMNSGQTLEVQATDPAFEADVRAWSQKTGHPLVDFVDDEVKTAVIRKS